MRDADFRNQVSSDEPERFPAINRRLSEAIPSVAELTAPPASPQGCRHRFTLKQLSLCLFVLGFAVGGFAAEDALPPLTNGKVPRNLDELWGNYDPRKEALDTKVVREWKEGEVTCRYVVFTIGTFKGKVSRIAGFYAFPSDTKEKRPALLHLHGGGQRANLTVVVFMALNGYAGLSINWGGNPMEGMKEGEPNTDWGALDATQRGHNSHYSSLEPDEKTLDAVASPRNNNWFLLVLAARRGLTFLERQPEVDPGRLGVCGHSMGGKLTTDLAGIDRRVKVAVPSCGGSGSAPGTLSGMPGSGLRQAKSDLHAATIDDRAYIPRIQCPIMYLSPTNDFAGPLDNMVENWKKIASKNVRYAISPHFNHRHDKTFSVSQHLWFEQHLKDGPPLPETPKLTLSIENNMGMAVATLEPDRPDEVVRASIYYSIDPHVLTRFWREAKGGRRGDAWIAICPVLSTDQPLYVIANVHYPLKRTFKGYQWMEFEGVKEFALSSTMLTCRPAELKASTVRATARPEATIDDFARGWNDWYRLQWRNPHVWHAATRKVKDPQWRGPDGAKLAVDVRSPAGVTLVVRVQQNQWGAFPKQPGGEYAASQAINGSDDWQTVTFALQDFLPTNERTKANLQNWRCITELALCGSAEAIRDGQKVKLGGKRWVEPRQFRNLRWVGGQRAAEAIDAGKGTLTPEQLEDQIKKSIRQSTDQEKRERGGK